MKLAERKVAMVVLLVAQLAGDLAVMTAVYLVEKKAGWMVAMLD